MSLKGVGSKRSGSAVVVIALAGLLALTAIAVGPAPAAAAKLRIRAGTRTASQGQIWQSRSARAFIGANRRGRARIVLIAGRSRRTSVAISARRRVRVRRNRRRVVRLPLTAAGRRYLARCDNRVIGVRVRFKPKRRKARRVRRTRPLTVDLGICSVGSENPVARPYFGDPIPTPNADRCDLLATAHCMQPWPSDFFTVASAQTATGKRLNLHPQSTPRASMDPDSHIDPTNWNKSDGFSPGSTIVVRIPLVATPQAFANTGAVGIDDLSGYAAAGQPVVVINAETGERHPIWAELDSRPFDPAPGARQGTVADVNLLIHPARNFDEGARYIVALRNLRDAADRPVEPPLGFRVYRDRLITSQQPVERRRAHMESLFSGLQSEGIQRSNLYLAWDFTVASEDALSRWMLAMRDDALGTHLGDPDLDNGVVEGDAPAFTITNVDTAPTNPNLLRIVDGTLTGVPCYLEHATEADQCAPGARFAFDGPDDLDPNFSGATTTVPFKCVIPSSVTDGLTVTAARSAMFGHGLLGTRDEVVSDNAVVPLAAEHNIAFCAVDWAGFSAPDLGTVLGILVNMSNFPQLPDRVQQGYINFIYLGRAMLHPNGFNSDPAFQVDPADPQDAVNGGTPVLDPDELFFEGISQGAVLGGGLTAVSPDISRSVLNVAGMNYSLLLPRSVHWVDTTDPGTQYEEFLGNNSLFEGPLLLSFLQTLWDRGETDGYAHHATDDPYPDTPPHEVLLQAAFGDFQVGNIAAEVEARTMGMSVYTPALDPGRHWQSDPFVGIPAIASFPFEGSALVYWDGGPETFIGSVGLGTKTPPNTNTAPRASLGYGADPHGYPRRDAQARQQISDFFDGGFGICTDGIDLLTAIPCYDNGWTGP